MIIPSGTWPQLAALRPAIGFAFLFNNLVIMMCRRLEKAVLKGPQPDPTLAEPSQLPMCRRPSSDRHEPVP